MASRTFFVGGNWKCDVAGEDVEKIVTGLNESQVPSDDIVEVVVSPPFVFLQQVKSLLRLNFAVAAQNCSLPKDGTLTGEISAETLVNLQVPWVILGHSERRAHLSESSESVADKVVYALKHGLKIIACIGDTPQQREAGETVHVVSLQTRAIADKISDWKNLVLAYVPLCSIGTVNVSTPTEAQEVHNGLRNWLRLNINPEVAESLRIIYGGPVNAVNCKEFAGQPDIDGFLLGGASLKPEFVTIIKSATAGAVQNQHAADDARIVAAVDDAIGGGNGGGGGAIRRGENDDNEADENVVGRGRGQRGRSRGPRGRGQGQGQVGHIAADAHAAHPAQIVGVIQNQHAADDALGVQFQGGVGVGSSSGGIVAAVADVSNGGGGGNGGGGRGVDDIYVDGGNGGENDDDDDDEADDAVVGRGRGRGRGRRGRSRGPRGRGQGQVSHLDADARVVHPAQIQKRGHRVRMQVDQNAILTPEEGRTYAFRKRGQERRLQQPARELFAASSSTRSRRTYTRQRQVNRALPAPAPPASVPASPPPIGVPTPLPPASSISPRHRAPLAAAIAPPPPAGASAPPPPAAAAIAPPPPAGASAPTPPASASAPTPPAGASTSIAVPSPPTGPFQSDPAQSDSDVDDGGDGGGIVQHGGDISANVDRDEFLGFEYHNISSNDLTKEKARYYSVVRDLTEKEICCILLNHQNFDCFDQKNPEELGVHVTCGNDDLTKALDGFQLCPQKYNAVVGPHTITGEFYSKVMTYGVLHRLSVALLPAEGDQQQQTIRLIQTKCLTNNGCNCISLSDNISTLVDSIGSTINDLPKSGVD